VTRSLGWLEFLERDIFKWKRNIKIYVSLRIISRALRLYNHVPNIGNHYLEFRKWNKNLNKNKKLKTYYVTTKKLKFKHSFFSFQRKVYEKLKIGESYIWMACLNV